MSNQKKTIYPVWVNGMKLDGTEKAAECAGYLSGRKIEAGWLAKNIQEHGSLKVHGILISVLGPKGSDDVEFYGVKADSHKTHKAMNSNRLLYYPPGEDILERGLCHGRR